MTKQEMLIKAVLGLRSQGFQRSITVRPDEDGIPSAHCVYQNPDGLRCAWGHVDLSLKDEECGVFTLYTLGVGIAATLSPEERHFASRLQKAHDTGVTPERMEFELRELASKNNLTFPETP